MTDSTIAIRLQAANLFINVIASHSHQYFRDKTSSRVAVLHLDATGKVWILDEYTQLLVNTHIDDDWDGFNHGGNLRSLVQRLRDFVVTGKTLGNRYFTPTLPGDPANNYWEYDDDAILEVRSEGIRLGVIKPL